MSVFFFIWQHITSSYPYAEESADRLVVTSLQLHVTSVFELLHIVAPPQDPVTPSRDAALPTAGNRHSFRGKVKGQTSDTHTVLLTLYWLCISVMIRLENTSSWAKCNQDYKEEKLKNRRQGTAIATDLEEFVYLSGFLHLFKSDIQAFFKHF